MPLKPQPRESSFKLTPGKKVHVLASAWEPVRIRVEGATVYYGASESVTAVSYDGTVASGGTEVFRTSKWVLAETNARVDVHKVPPNVTLEEATASSYVHPGYTGIFLLSGASEGNAFEIGTNESTAYTRFKISNQGEITFDDGTDAFDTNLYRSAANTLKTDDALAVGGNFAVNGATPAAAPNYTVSNHSDDRSLNESGDTTAQVANVLGTLINDLIAMGILQ